MLSVAKAFGFCYAVLAAWALLANPAAAQNAALFAFAAFGDTPYTRDEEARFPDLIAKMNWVRIRVTEEAGRVRFGATPGG